MDKILGKLKQIHNAFPELQSKFHKQCVILSFAPSFNEFYHNFNIFKILVLIPEQFTMTKKVNFNKRYVPLSFSK